MKLFSCLGLFVIGSLPCAFGATNPVNPQLAKVQSVYILSMSNGMDQFLANRLTSTGVFQVVADPQKADAILTDRLGEGFEDKMRDLYPAPPVPKKADDEDKEGKAASPSAPPINQWRSAPVQSTWSRGRGNIFLVDRRSLGVIWSLYERPRSSSPDELSRAATKVVDRLKKDLEPPKARE